MNILSIVIPAYNEENRLPDTLSSTIKFLNEIKINTEIIVVCDGCTDRTTSVASEFKNDFKELKIINYPGNKGKGYAVKKGMMEANGLYRLFMDADMSVPIGHISQFLELIRFNDIVIASRGHSETMVTVHQKFYREAAGKLFGRLQKLILKIPIYDTQCGFKMFTAEAAEFLFPKLKYDCSYFDAELLYIAYNSGFKIHEAPVTWRHDGETRMPIGISRTIDLINKLFRLSSLHRKN